MGWIIAEAWDSSTSRGAADDWIESEFKGSFDRASIESRFRQICGFDGENPSWTKRLKHRNGLWEIRVTYGGKQVRMLARERMARLVVLSACVKKDKIPETCFTKAEQRWSMIENGDLDVRDYPLDGD